jgi:hypothetical protein
MVSTPRRMVSTPREMVWLPIPNGMDPGRNGIDPARNGIDPARNGIDPAANGIDPAANGIDPAARGEGPFPPGIAPFPRATAPAPEGDATIRLEAGETEFASAFRRLSRPPADLLDSLPPPRPFGSPAASYLAPLGSLGSVRGQARSQTEFGNEEKRPAARAPPACFRYRLIQSEAARA